MRLPECFCWTRFGTEAGQSVDQILARKDQERIANGGLFFWGIGNAVGPSITELLRHCPKPEVIFSPIKTGAREPDVRPASVVAWTAAESLDGTSYALPPSALVTSRFEPESPKIQHYALVCSSETCLTSVGGPSGVIGFSNLVNLRTGRPVGASQVTAVVRRVEGTGAPIRSYPVALRTKLAAPFFLRLRNPVLISRLDGTQSWDSAVRQAWEDTRRPIQAN